MSNPIGLNAGQQDPNGQASNPESREPKSLLGKSKTSIPAAVTSMGKILGKLLLPAAVGFTGWYLSDVQFKVTNMRQDADSADQARETKEQVLTDYSKTIQDLFVTRNPLGVGEDGFVVNDDQKNIARGHTLIALRRLNVADDNDDQSTEVQSVFDLLNPLKSKTDKEDERSEDAKDGLNRLNIGWNPFKTKEQSKADKDDEKVDSGKLKGLLIRYLYDTQLLGYGYLSEGLVRLNLAGADINNVVLDDAWLPSINLRNTWLTESSFRNADLWGADFTGAKLTGADFTGADLRFANLFGADLSDAELAGACYVEGTEADYFPPDFKPAEHNMIAVPEEQSDPSQVDFLHCTTP